MAQQKAGNACHGRDWIAERRIRIDTDKPVAGHGEAGLFFWNTKETGDAEADAHGVQRSDHFGTQRRRYYIREKFPLEESKAPRGVAQWNFFNLAVTPDMILGASKMETLREALARRAGTGGAGLASVPQFCRRAPTISGEN